jgi:hypothetical protein
MLTSHLSGLCHSSFVIKDSFDFANKIRDSTNVDKKMISLDVTNLFTNVALACTIDYILDGMYPACHTKCEHLAMIKTCTECKKRTDVDKLLRAATFETHFTFENTMYMQHTDLTMSAPLTSVLANIFMAHMETTLMDEVPKIGVCEWYIYVNDTFVLVSSNMKVNDILSIFNTFQPSIEFTHNIETYNSLVFLDVKVTRSNKRDTFETMINCELTLTGLMINWDSFVPIQCKKASIASMVRRALAICSSYSSISVGFDEIQRIT